MKTVWRLLEIGENLKEGDEIYDKIFHTWIKVDPNYRYNETRLFRRQEIIEDLKLNISDSEKAWAESEVRQELNFASWIDPVKYDRIKQRWIIDYKKQKSKIGKL